MIGTVTIASLLLGYSSPSLFNAPTHEGGGGGRHFTGSHADGLGCNACHGGGEPLALEIDGLPIGGWSPGLTYTLDIAWSPTVEHAGVLLELTNESGAALGQLSLPPDEQLTNAERCDSGTRAAKQIELDDGRRVVAIGDCGAHRLRVQWQAPEDDPSSTAWLHVAGVRGDGSGDAAGDGPTLETFELTRLGAQQETDGCQVASKSSATLAGLALLLGFGFAARRKSRPACMLVLAMLALGGCARVQPWERSRLAQPDMQLQVDPELVAGSDHAVEYREGSAGATGGAGGGCGCN